MKRDLCAKKKKSIYTEQRFCRNKKLTFIFDQILPGIVLDNLYAYFISKQ